MTTTNPIILGEATVDSPTPTAVPAPTVKSDPVLDRLLSRIGAPEQTSNYLKVMIYSEPGVGKTTLAGTAPNPLVIDIERGTRTLAGTNAEVIEYISIEQIEKLVEYLVAGNDAFDKYETIVFDSLSEMQRRLLDQQLGKASAMLGSDLYKADFAIWGENTQRLRALMSKFRDIKKNIIVTAQAKMDKDESTGVPFLRPDLTPKLSATVTGLFDIVGYMKINSKGERILQCQPTKTVVAKTRVTTLPKEITNPTWASFNN